jgi:hypothetical protein
MFRLKNCGSAMQLAKCSTWFDATACVCRDSRAVLQGAGDV